VQITCPEFLENLGESGFNEDKMTEDIGTHKSFKYENCKIQIYILSEDRRGKFALSGKNRRLKGKFATSARF